MNFDMKRMALRTLRRACCGTAVFCLTLAAMAAEHSDLWGANGEKWTPESRLPEFSHAGYHCGERAIPTVPKGVSIKEFGAKGDGVADDTQAFLDAIAKAPGAIEIPAGRYKITKILEIKRSGVVLRGAGQDKTFLCFPTTLNEIKPDWGATTTGDRTSNYSWSGGFVWVKGDRGWRRLSLISAPAKRGAMAVQVESAAEIKPGQRVEVFQYARGEKATSLYEALYSGDTGDTRKLRGAGTGLVCRVTKVEGNMVHFDRPLRAEVRPEWGAQIHRFEPTVSEVGIENLCFEFPNTPYKGHFTELGYNAIAMSDVADCWARDIRIVNCDSGLFPHSVFCTFQGVTFESARQQEKTRHATGHHGVYLGGDDNLFTGFNFKTRFMHDITVARCAGNVCSCGQGEDMCFDHHKYAPIENLFCNIDAGEGSRLWQCGGGAALGKNCGAGGTFWNIRARRPLAYPPASFGPWSMNLVGLFTNQPSVKEPRGKWFEAIKPEALEPQDIHAAQLEKRLKEQRKE